MGLIERGGPAPRRRARSLEAGLLRRRAAHARTLPHAGKWGGGGSPSLVTRNTRVFRGRAPTCGWAAMARLAIARAAFRMHLHPACSCARGNERGRGWLAGGCLDADLPHAACRLGRNGLGPWVCRRPASCGCGGGGSWLCGARDWLLGVGVLVRWRWRAELALRSRCTRAALALRYTHAGLRGAGVVGSPRRRRQLPLLVSPLLLSLCRHHPCQSGFTPLPPSIPPITAPPHQNPARTCHTRRAGAGATGSGHGRVGVPRAAAAAAGAAAAASAPSSAASAGC